MVGRTVERTWTNEKEEELTAIEGGEVRGQTLQGFFLQRSQRRFPRLLRTYPPATKKQEVKTG